MSTFHGQLITCSVGNLHPHPSYLRHQLTVPSSKLSALTKRGDLAFQQPLVITPSGIIIDGYARWDLARRQGRLTLPCVQYELTEAEALDWLLQSHRRSDGLNAFCRILLALDLEPLLQEKARSNQRTGGQSKGSSNLTGAERLDVRCEIASAADVSAGNVTKVKQLIVTADADLLEALRSGEIRIHRAWLWSKLPPEAQREELRTYRSERGVKKTIRNLLAQHRPKNSPDVVGIGDLARRLSAVESSRIGPVRVAVIKVPGRAVFISEELFRALGLQKELALICSPKNP